MLRGSIPLYWQHTNIANPKPDTKINYEKGMGGTGRITHILCTIIIALIKLFTF